MPGFAQAHRKRQTARITATPSVLAANKTTSLDGTGFPADKTIVLRECPTKDSGAFRYACDASEMTVETDASGGFTASFPVAACHGQKKLTRPQKCYVGDFEARFDAFLLIGAVKLTVTP